MTERLFARLKIIDCGSWIAGRAAATILSDHDRAGRRGRPVASLHAGARQTEVPMETA
jgi:hypothetical protein